MNKRLNTLMAFLLITPLLFGLTTDSGSDEYILIGWNDLGMHCSNKDFSKLVVLPPYNNIYAQVIKRGDKDNNPQVVTEGLKIKYSIPGNTYSVGKTNFWDYAEYLFGTDLPDNVGLTGAKLKGEMNRKDDHFVIEGVPITPYKDNDLNNEDPFQKGLLKLFDTQKNLLAKARPVIPVSNEIGCVSKGCHKSEEAILDKHDDEDGFDPKKGPILCAKCHASNALGTKGRKGVKSLSFVIHEKHKEKAENCYKCHPGENTKCLRGVMAKKGMECKDCHGSMKTVAESIEKGRRPWLDEPKCGSSGCHGSAFAEEKGKLYRESKGHGGLYCSACHGSPHAIYPSTNKRDNAQIVALQGYKGILEKCSVCHGVMPDGRGPHNIKPEKIAIIEKLSVEIESALMQNFPNPISSHSTIPFEISEEGAVRMEIYDMNGKQMISIINQYLMAGEYTVRVPIELLNNGTYIYALTLSNKKIASKMLTVAK